MRGELLKYQLVVMVPPLENGMNQCLGWIASLMWVQELQAQITISCCLVPIVRKIILL